MDSLAQQSSDRNAESRSSHGSAHGLCLCLHPHERRTKSQLVGGGKGRIRHGCIRQLWGKREGLVVSSCCKPDLPCEPRPKVTVRF
ncbi:hypothetical protein CLOP_g3198 [Closterium sp. NIES-67]|nr:hypothetical protein CLOP_g3198 [Closterium sp. NIES-67]